MNFIAIILAILITISHNSDTETFIINGPSMEPTLKNNERVEVDLTFYETNPINRNDLVYFRSGNETSYIKRVIGLPNEVIVIKGNTISIDGKVVITFDNVSAILEEGTYSTGPEEYFVIGDNINNSFDSRAIGPIKRNQILGKITNK